MAVTRFKCPTCLRATMRAPESGTTATDVRDLKCPKCGARWRYLIRSLVIPGCEKAIAVINTARLN